jgi:hypothetical protein
MALANYADLVTNLPLYSGRGDETAFIPIYVSLAESDFNRELRTPDMLVNNPSFVISGEYVNVPAGFMEMKDWYLNVSPRSALTYMPDDTMTGYYNSSGPPSFYTMSGNQFRIGPAPDGYYTSTISYYQLIPGLQANSVNWLMTMHPNIYLFNCLMQSALRVQDDISAQKWMQAYTTELNSIKSAGRRQRWGGTGMAVRVL